MTRHRIEVVDLIGIVTGTVIAYLLKWVSYSLFVFVEWGTSILPSLRAALYL
jgi:hypothetical protein